jgi:hypothetical protein
MMKQALAMALGMLGGAVCSLVTVSRPMAQEAGISLLSNGENFAVRYGTMHRGNRVGGSAVLSVTGGEEGVITYAPGGPDQVPMIPHLTGAGESQVIAYSLPAPTGTMLARTAPATVAQELAEAPAPRR